MFCCPRPPNCCLRPGWQKDLQELPLESGLSTIKFADPSEFKVKPTGPHMISHGFPCSVLESYRPYNRQAQCASWFKETLRSGGK